MPSERQVRWASFRVLSVSVVAVCILMVLAYLLTGGTLLEQKAHLYLSIPDATGLDSGSPVRVDGIGVGKVDWVRLSGSNDPARVIRLQITIERQRLTSITADSVAEIDNDTLVGDKFVEITTGKAPGHAPENGELIFKAQPDLMRSVDLTEFERQLRLVDAMLTDIELARTPLGEFVVGDQVYVSLRGRLAELQGILRGALATNATLGNLLYTDTLVQKIHAPLAQVDAAIALMQSGQGGMGHFLRDPAQYQQLRTSLEDLQKSVVAARAADFMKTEEAYRDWSHTAASAARQVDQINASPLLNSTELYESWNGSLREMQKTLKDFRENPRKYLRMKVF